MTIKKGETITFQTLMSARFYFKDPTIAAFAFHNVIALQREEANNMVLTRLDGSKVLVLGDSYFFVDIEQQIDEESADE
jgi:hypothetical protein